MSAISMTSPSYFTHWLLKIFLKYSPGVFSWTLSPENAASLVCGHLVNFAWESCGSNVCASRVDCSLHGRNLFFPQLRTDILATPFANSQASLYIREHFH